MHIHLDPVGGVAGDMFVAALLDAWPALETELVAAFAAAGFTRIASLQRLKHRDHALTGTRFCVQPVAHDHGHDHGHVYDSPLDHHHHHRSFREIKNLLQESALSTPVKEHAVGIFALLADAEGRVHGVPADEVSFHEVGAWDSIADIVCAAWLIDALAVASWSCAPLPAGSGRVATAHGLLPVPAPATTLLLAGFPLFQDNLQGERITPTGAAILRYLQPDFQPLRIPRRLERSGIGFGTKTFSGISNILRIMAFASVDDALKADEVAVCRFELDDQTGEDLAIALDRLREQPDVLDVIQTAVMGKKGRLAVQVQVLARPQGIETLLQHCFRETTTLGVRWQIVQRAVLERVYENHEQAGNTIRLKRARRPDGVMTSKAEIDDIARHGGDRAGREKLRRKVEEDDER